jgi:hypothetical protein
VIALAESGKLKGIKEGYQWKFRIADVMDYMEKHKIRKYIPPLLNYN